MGVSISYFNDTGTAVYPPDLGGLEVADGGSTVLYGEPTQNVSLEKIRSSALEDDGYIRTNIAVDLYLIYNSDGLPAPVNLTSEALLDKYLNDYNQGNVDQVENEANKKTEVYSYEVGSSKTPIYADIATETSSAEVAIVLPGTGTDNWYLKANTVTNNKTGTYDVEFIKNDAAIPPTPANVVYTESVTTAKGASSEDITGISFVGGDEIRIRITGTSVNVRKLKGQFRIESVD
jgi:hypothetical protein